MKTNNDKFERVIKTEKTEINKLVYDSVEYLLKWKKSGLAADTDEFFFRLIIDELLANAFKHGNKGNPDKNIHVQITPKGSHVEIMVEDQGVGFSMGKVPDPTKENKYKKSGRGIKLMQEVSEIRCNKKGNCLYCKL